MKVAIAATAVLAALSVAAVTTTSVAVSGTATGSVNLYDNPELLGGAYAEPVSTLTVVPFLGNVCTATDSSHVDQNTYYVVCADYVTAGGRIH